MKSEQAREGGELAAAKSAAMRQLLGAVNLLFDAISPQRLVPRLCLKQNPSREARQKGFKDAACRKNHQKASENTRLEWNSELLS